MTNPVKALLFDIRTFLADNNIRRNTSAFSVNYGSTSEDVSQNTFSLAPNAAKTLVTPMNPCVVTLLRTSVPLTAQVTLRDATTFTLTVSKVLLLDADITLLILTNSSATDIAKVSLTQG